MPTKRRKRTRKLVQDVTPTEHYWLTGEVPSDGEINEFELDLGLRHPVHETEVRRALELLRAYPRHAERNHPGRAEELQAKLTQLQEAARRREAKQHE